MEPQGVGMSKSGAHDSPYFLIWVYLVILALASVASSIILPRGVSEVAIYLLAAVKAVLVALYFMHLRVERIFIHSLSVVPLLLVLILFLGLVPDIVFSR